MYDVNVTAGKQLTAPDKADPFALGRYDAEAAPGMHEKIVEVAIDTAERLLGCMYSVTGGNGANEGQLVAAAGAHVMVPERVVVTVVRLALP